MKSTPPPPPLGPGSKESTATTEDTPRPSGTDHDTSKTEKPRPFEPIPAVTVARRGALLVGVLFGVIASVVAYFALPLMPMSQHVVGLQASIRADRSEAQHLRRSTTMSEHELRSSIDEILARTAEREEALAGYGLAGGYWARLMSRDGAAAERVGVFLIFAILALLLATLAYYCWVTLHGCYPGNWPSSKNARFATHRHESLQRRWDQSSSIEAVARELETLSALDESHVAYYLLPLRWAEWLMPVLGFIGTVIGISAAIGSLQSGIRLVFAQGRLTSGALEHFNLGFGGLGVAFDTTFFGLLGLGTIGSLAFFARRRALGEIASIDQVEHSWIQTLFEKPSGRSLAAIAEAVDEFKDWLDEEGLEQIRREVEANGELREWFYKRLPALLWQLSNHTSAETRMAVSGASGEIRRRIDTYGELITRLTGHQASELAQSRRLHVFALLALYEAAHERPADPFWRRFIEEIGRPFDQQFRMSLIEESSPEREVAGLAINAAADRVAIATRNTRSGESEVRVHAVDIPSGCERVAHLTGASEMDAGVTALAFDSSGRRLGFCLEDGTVGLLELETGDVCSVLLEGVESNECSLAWWTHEAEGFAVLLRWQERTRFVFVPLTALLRASNDPFDQHTTSFESLTLDGAHIAGGCAMVNRRMLFVASNDVKKPRLLVVQRRQGRFVAEPSAELPNLDCNVSCLTEVAGGGHMLCGMSDGSVHDVRLVGQQVSRVIGPRPAPVLLAARDGIGGCLVSVIKGADELRIVDEVARIEKSVQGFGPISHAVVSERGVIAVGGAGGHVALWEFPRFIVSPPPAGRSV